jgi:fructose-specific phosphotransferase system IIC component
LFRLKPLTLPPLLNLNQAAAVAAAAAAEAKVKADAEAMAASVAAGQVPPYALGRFVALAGLEFLALF